MKFTRQLNIFDPSHYNHYRIAVIGCGAIGSFTALTLGKMGFTDFILFDKDKVEEHNIPNQFFKFDYVGYYKTEAVRYGVNSHCRNTDIREKRKKFIKDDLESYIVISAVDSLRERKKIYRECLKQDVRLLIDGRMGGEVLTVYTVDLTNKKAREDYEKSFKIKAIEIPCTERSIIYNVLGVSSIIACQLTKVMKGEKYSSVIDMDYRNMVMLKSGG